MGTAGYDIVFWAHCPQCGRCYEVQAESLDDPQVPLTGDSFPCVTALCNGRLRKYRKDQSGTELERILTFSRVVVPVSRTTFYQMVAGLDVEPVTAARIVKAASGKRIAEFVLQPDGSDKRVIVDTIVLEDGTRIHLAPSVKGACIYRIEEPHAGPRTSENADPNREEGRRGDAPAG